jgi:tetratricopeptide (TPR) repeat protein
VVIFCATGFLASVGILYAAWKRYFSNVSVGVLAAGALALGLATIVPVMLPRSDVYEVAISCGYMLTMLALGAIWGALHEPERRCWWLGAASAAYGLAVGARPTLLFGAVIVVVPVIQAWREGRRVWTPLAATIVPIALIGSGLLLYNTRRFDNPFEFGQHYQLAAVPSATFRYFRTRFFWFNFRVYFLEPGRWSARFPFVHKIAAPPLPIGYEQVEYPFGILSSIPFVWLAAAVPLAWRGRSAQEALTLRGFVAATAWLFVACALPLAFFSSAIIRYEVDFAPVLVLLAVIGLLGLERALIGQPVWRSAARWGWGALLGFSIAFNLLGSIQVYAGRQCALGVALAQEGHVPEAIQSFQQTLRLDPDFPAAHDELGRALERSGDTVEAVQHYQQAVLLRPDYVAAQVDLANALLGVGNFQDAIAHYEQALQINPDDAAVHNNLGNILLREGKINEAIAHYEQALRIKPDYAEAHYNLGVALVRLGKPQEAMGHWEQALQVNPDYAEAHYNLAMALELAGKTPEAIEHLRQALRIKPDFAQARNTLTRLQAH